MAISCLPTITVVDISKRIVKIVCVITVDETHSYTVSVENADISTSAKKTEAANSIWAKLLVMHQKRLAEDSVQAEIAALTLALKTNIEGRVI